MIGRKMNVRLSDGAELPRYSHDGDAGLDLRITHDVTLEPGARATVGTGLAVEIPQGCVGLVFPRSGLVSKHGITLSNSVGVIDSGYRGEIGATLLNQSDETTTLDAGTRVCQLIVMPFVPCELVPCEELTETERGAAGFGSTGIA
jgi:dUTP pyrophosphatase